MSYDPLFFNIDPYYDDYNEDKKFLRMLFRPGYAVQARELTQLQSILQSQIEKFGKNVFNEGSLVYGGELVDSRVKYARVSGLTGTQTISDLVGAELSNTTTNVTARVIHTEPALSNSTVDGFPVIFFEYTSGGTAFSSGSTVNGFANNTLPFSFTVAGITAGAVTGQSIGDALLISSGSGIRFIEGFFVSNNQQTIAACTLTGPTGAKVRLFANANSRIGFSVDKKIITETDDTSLQDPSFGFYNYAAPGSDRFKIDLPIVQYPYSPTDDLSTATTDNFSNKDFIEFVRVVDGTVIKRDSYPDYAVIGETLARRTYDESGNYTTEPFNLTVSDDKYGATGATFSAIVGSGKAYVFGYEFETIGNTRLDLPRALATNTTEDAHIQSVIGPWVYGSITGGTFPANGLTSFDIAKMPTVYLSGSKGASAFAQIGTAKTRGVQFVGGSGDKNWRIDLFDISMSSGSQFSQTNSMFVPGKTGTAEALFSVYNSNGAELNDYSNTLLFETSAGVGVKTISELDYKVRFAKKVLFSATGTAEITTNQLGLGTNQNQSFFDYGVSVTTPSNTFIIIDETGDSVSGAIGKTGSYNNTLYISGGPTSATGTVMGEVRMNYNGATSNAYVKRTKTLVTETISVTGSVLYTTGPTGGTNGAEYRLLNKKIDVFSVNAVTGASGQSLSKYFVLDTGNRDNYYDWSSLIFAPGYSSGSTAGLTGTLDVSLNRFDHGSGAGPFTVQSYDSIDFRNIPTYTSPDTGKKYRLSNTIDFRPDRQTDGTFSPFCYPVSTATGLVTVQKYLPRTDKLVLTRDKKFKIVSGIPSESAPTPSDDPNSMTLYTLNIPQYTYSKDDIAIRAIKNKRYTMQDIGNLERRLDAVEYFTSMSLLEQEANNTSITDSIGDVVPKKGILVDGFRGHNIGDVTNSMYNASVDAEFSSLRPAFSTKVFRLSMDAGAEPAQYNYSPTANPLSITGNRLFTMGYTAVAGIIQPQASSTRQLNPYGVVNYTGVLFTNPDSDFWFSDTQRPYVKVNPRGEKDNWAFSTRGTVGAEGGTGPGQGTGFGTQWNDWETMWFGKSNFDETNQNLANKTLDDMSLYSTSNANTQLDKNQSPESIVTHKSTEKVNNDVEFYARNIQVLVRADGLKPNTKLWAFLDDSTTPSEISITTQGATGVTTTGATGFVITDSKGSFGGVSEGSVGYALYLNSGGTLKTGQKLIRFCDNITNSVSQTTTVAEKIFPIEGSYGTKETEVVSTRKPIIKRASPSSPIVANNIFTKNVSTTSDSKGIVEPLSQSFTVDPVIYPSGIFVDSIDLWFYGKDSQNVPVILELKSMVNGFPHPSKTLPSAVVTLFTNDIVVSPFATVSTKFKFKSPVYLVPGTEYCFSLRTSSDKFSIHTAKISEFQYRPEDSDPYLTVTEQPFVKDMFTAQNQNKLLKETREDLKFVINLCKFNRGVSTIQTKNVVTNYYGTTVNPSMVRFEIPINTPPGTKVTVTEQGILSNSEVSVLLNKNTARYSEAAIGVTGQFTTTALSLASDNDYVSPVIDLDRACVVLVENQVNENKVGSVNANGELSVDNRNLDSSVRSASRYITKKINLEYPATQLDVFLQISNPPHSSVEVFARTLPDETDAGTQFHNRGYQLMSASSDKNTTEGEYQNIRYTLGLTQEFSTFAIKIVMYGSNQHAKHPVPVISSMKVIAT